MVKPVMVQLKLNQIQVVLISLCEFRRMQTPVQELQDLRIPYVCLASLKLKGTSTSTGKKYIGGNQAIVRNLIREVIWHLKVKKELGPVNQPAPDWAVVPNDIAYPFSKICKWLTKKKIPFLLFQEGIRFPLPNEEGGMPYGTNGAKEILTWGVASTRYFLNLGVKSKVISAGNPRFDTIFNQKMKFENNQIPFAKYNILYVSNPVDDQGFCSHDEKIRLFTKFVQSMKEMMDERDIHLFVRLHPREDLESFKSAAATIATNRIIWAQQFSLFEYLQKMDLTIVLASTVGLESMMVNVPIGVIKLPGHGFVFDYVQSGSAVGIDVDTDFTDHVWNAITVDQSVLKEKSLAYIKTQLANRGDSVTYITNHILNLVNGH
ncbi:MAG: hypothetical protein HYZ44_00195 [Bacteroidetes bacterium]|nr:hypothetical protein [Bacteroidota bacterium]